MVRPRLHVSVKHSFHYSDVSTDLLELLRVLIVISPCAVASFDTQVFATRQTLLFLITYPPIPYFYISLSCMLLKHGLISHHSTSIIMWALVEILLSANPVIHVRSCGNSRAKSNWAANSNDCNPSSPLRLSHPMATRTLEFYSGIGGLHLALARSNVDAEVVQALDWDQTACTVYSANHEQDIATKVPQPVRVLEDRTADG